jgi:hypothetical protein
MAEAVRPYHPFGSFRQVLECTAACAQTQIGTPWTEMMGPKGAVMFADFQNYFRIFPRLNSCSELWFLSDLFDWIWLDLIGNLIGMEMFNIFQLSQYSTDFAWIGRMFSFVAVKESAPGHVVYVVLPHRHEAVLPVTRNLSRLVPWGHQGSPGQGWRWRNHWRIWHTLW